MFRRQTGLWSSLEPQAGTACGALRSLQQHGPMNSFGTLGPRACGLHPLRADLCSLSEAAKEHCQIVRSRCRLICEKLLEQTAADLDAQLWPGSQTPLLLVNAQRLECRDWGAQVRDSLVDCHKVVAVSSSFCMPSCCYFQHARHLRMPHLDSNRNRQPCTLPCQCWLHLPGCKLR